MMAYKKKFKAIYSAGMYKGASVFRHSFATKEGAKKSSRVVTSQGYKVKIVPVKRRKN